MAHAHRSQNSVALVHSQPLIHPQPPVVNAPVGFVPRPVGVINPSFGPVPPFDPASLPQPGFVLNPAVLVRMEHRRSISLLQFMSNEGLIPSPEEELKRKNVIEKLKEIVLTWVKRVAWQRQRPKQQIAVTSATILTYGSYGLGVHGPESDIDALCVGPFFASMADDFFIVLRNMLESRPEVSEIHCVKDAKVPLMRFKFDGISVDLPYAQLKLLYVPENLNVLNPYFLRNIDETSWKSLSGVRANECILQLVPNVENFQSILRCIKLWAKRRGVYGNLFGYFGGVHLAILAAFVCQKNPHANLNVLMSSFFKTFSGWPWPTPVALEDGRLPTGGTRETRALMPIQLPCSPYGYCHSNITKSTFYRITTELTLGHALTRDLLRLDFDWNDIFEPFCYSKKYSRFIKIYLSSSNQDELGDWVGWVKSRFRFLLAKVEEVQGLCDPNPTEFIDPDAGGPNVVFFWGVQPGRINFSDIDVVEDDFMQNINNGGYQGPPGKMNLSVIPTSQLPGYAHLDTGSRNRTKACWRMFNYHQPRVPVFSQHLPLYFVGYAATDKDAKRLDAWS